MVLKGWYSSQILLFFFTVFPYLCAAIRKNYRWLLEGEIRVFLHVAVYESLIYISADAPFTTGCVLQLIISTKKLISEQNPEECDARDGEQRTGRRQRNSKK